MQPAGSRSTGTGMPETPVDEALTTISASRAAARTASVSFQSTARASGEIRRQSSSACSGRRATTTTSSTRIRQRASTQAAAPPPAPSTMARAPGSGRRRW